MPIDSLASGPDLRAGKNNLDNEALKWLFLYESKRPLESLAYFN